MKLVLNTIHQLDCIEGMRKLEPDAVDLVFADPPFNIGYQYDVYEDRKAAPEYLNWSREWITGVHRVLKPTGTFWLAIGDDYAAELKLLCQDVGFHCRSWVIWYYTFGVNCKLKFSRSHTHIFHFVKDSKQFTFNNSAIAVPSARQLVYADARASKEGRLPDDTWILRPQDLTDGLHPDDDTWYFPRVAGTFKEREGFHGCQMPEQLLGRIIKVSSNPGSLVLDPFSGSATTVAVAKKLGRSFVAFDISDDYIARGLERLSQIEPGDNLDGAAEPKVSAPATPPKGVKKGKVVAATDTNDAPMPNWDAEVIEAFRNHSAGFSTDRVLIDPELNTAYLRGCQQAGVNLPPVLLNRYLLRLRKSGKLAGIRSNEQTKFDWLKADSYLFASEIAWRTVYDQTGASLDDIFCNPDLAQLFDATARKFAPDYTPFEYRWGALALRKAAKTVSMRSRLLDDPASKLQVVEDYQKYDGLPGLYVVGAWDKTPLFVGEALDLGQVLHRQFTTISEGWADYGSNLILRAVPYQRLPSLAVTSRGAKLSLWLVAYQCRLIRKTHPKLNLLGLKESAA